MTKKSNNYKSLLISDSFPPREGGSRAYYYNLCKHLPPDEIVVLTTKVDQWQDFDARHGFKILRKGFPLPDWKYKSLPKAFIPFVWTKYLILKYRIKVILCGDFFPAGPISLFAQKFFGIPYILFVHGEAVTGFDRFRFQPAFAHYLLKKANLIIAACEYAQDGIIKRFNVDPQKIHKITPGVDSTLFEDASYRDYLIHNYQLEGKKVLLTLGRLIERKGHDNVIKAMPSILNRIPNTVYLIAGRGSEATRLANLIHQLNLTDNVKLLGYIEDRYIGSLLSVCDLFIMPNREVRLDGPEGFGMVFVEANCAGKPVIGGNTGGTGDSIVDGVTGYRINPYDVNEIAEKSLTLLQNENIAEHMGHCAKERALKHFNWATRAESLRKIYLPFFSSQV